MKRLFFTISLLILTLGFGAMQAATCRVGVQTSAATVYFYVENGTTTSVNAQPTPGYVFVNWADGEISNPRMATITSDTLFVAEFKRGSAISDTICYKESYSFAGQTLTKTGRYIDTLVAYTGEDSLRVLNLFVSPKLVYDTIRTTILSGESYYCDRTGKSYTAQTIMYNDTFTYAYGCDSSVTRHMLCVLEDTPRIMYVMPEKHGKGNGSSWANATNDVGYAISKLAPIENGQHNEVWVAAGTYGKTKSYSILFRGNVSVYGGFAGTETDVDQREKVPGGEPWEFAHPTVFSGGDSIYCARYYDAKNASQTIYIDGITFEHGYYNGATYAAGVSLRGNTIFQNCIVRNNLREDNPLKVATENGGGIYATTGVTIKNCLIENNTLNTVTGYGAGLYATGGVTLENVIIRNNSLVTTTTGYGGGAYLKGGSLLTDVEVSNNSVLSSASAYGAGLSVSGSFTMTNVSVNDNLLSAPTAAGGAGLYLAPGTSGEGTISNSTLAGNTGAIYGGAIYHYNTSTSSLLLDKCRIYGNVATKYGSALYDKAAQLSTSIRNCLIYNNGGCSYAMYMAANKVQNNTFANNQGYVYVRYGTTASDIANNIVWGAPTASHAKIYGSSALTDLPVHNNATQSAIAVATWSRESNYVLNASNMHVAGPNFVSPTSFQGAPTSAAEAAELPSADWRVTAASLCVNGGATVSEIPTDILGVTRPQHDNYDIGAHEYEGEITMVTLTLLTNGAKYGSALTDDGLTSKTYLYGETAIFSATPKLGYVLKDWSDGSTDLEREVVMTSNLALTANFASIKDTVWLCPSELPYTHTFYSSHDPKVMEYPTSGTKTVTLKSVDDLDSVATLVIKTYPAYYVEDVDTIQVPEYSWRERDFFDLTTGDYVFYDSLLTAHGCDSVFALLLHVDGSAFVGEKLDIVDWTTNTIVVNTNGLTSAASASNWKIVYGESTYTKANRVAAGQSLLTSAADRTVNIATAALRPDSYILLKQTDAANNVESFQTYKVPHIFNADTTLSGTNQASIVLVRGGRLTIAEDTKVAAVYVYPGAELQINNDVTLTTDRLILRTKAFDAASLMNAGTLLCDDVCYTRIVADKSQSYQFALPFDCSLADVTTSIGSMTTFGSYWGLQEYDADRRAANGAMGNWKALVPGEATTIEAHKGYQLLSSSAYYYELYFPVAYTKDVDSINVAVKTQAEGDASDRGWNFISSPYTGTYMMGYAPPEEAVKISMLDRDNHSFVQSTLTQLKPVVPFYYQAKTDGALQFSTTTCSFAGPSALLARRVAEQQDEKPTQWLRLFVGNEQGATDETNIYLNPSKFTADYEIGYDVAKLSTSASRPLCWVSLACGDLAFAAIPDSIAEVRVPVSVYAPTDAEMTFSLEENDYLGRLEEVTLVDDVLGVETNLLLGDYSYDAQAGASAGRFSLRAKFRAPEVATELSDVAGEDGFRAVVVGNRLILTNVMEGAAVRMYDSAGRLLHSVEVSGSEWSVSVPAKGVYLLQVGADARKLIFE